MASLVEQSACQCVVADKCNPQPLFDALQQQAALWYPWDHGGNTSFLGDSGEPGTDGASSRQVVVVDPGGVACAWVGRGAALAGTPRAGLPCSHSFDAHHDGSATGGCTLAATGS